MNNYDDRQRGYMPNAFVIGMILGGVLAALFTPWSGQSTRRKMHNKMQLMREKMRDEAQNADEKLHKLAEGSEVMHDTSLDMSVAQERRETH